MEGFVPCMAEPDIWMHPNVDDLAFAVKVPKAFAKVLKDKHKFNLKGKGQLSFHLGYDFTCDKDGTLCMKPTNCIRCNTSHIIQAMKPVFLMPMSS